MLVKYYTSKLYITWVNVLSCFPLYFRHFYSNAHTVHLSYSIITEQMFIPRHCSSGVYIFTISLDCASELTPSLLGPV